MNNPPVEIYALPAWLRAWERFWFTPAAPARLALIRITCGLIVVYTLFVYSFHLQDDMGEYAWHDLLLRMDLVRDKPVIVTPLSGRETTPLPLPVNEFQREYAEAYRQTWGVYPPPPYPVSFEQVHYLNEFRVKFGVDLRTHGLTPPVTPGERAYAERYTTLWKMPPPAYPRDAAEPQDTEDYLQRWNQDPRTLYDRGWYAFSLWFHVTDPLAMAILHGLIVFTSILFTIGFATRLTSALTCFGSLCYIHRNPTMLFGADTMMNILLIYLMLSPCGAVCSVDQWLLRWWSKAKPGVVRWWYAFRKRPLPDSQEIAPLAVALGPLRSVSANLVIRLLQIHLCIIYLAAGLSKLQGTAWWSGTAVWGTIASYEFAPMQNEWYLDFLRFMGSNQLYFSLFISGGGYFTLAFEITYAFLIWRPRLRWFFLASAFLLHGFIGVLMGLTTFTIIMVVMNLAFLREEEADWIFRKFRWPTRTAAV